MKKTILKMVALSILMASSGAFASDYSYDTSSLLAIEGSYSSFDVENDDTPVLREKISFSGVGFKMGAETRNYRLFLSVKNSFIDDNYDYAYFYGAELQYLMHFASFANFYMGINTGRANLKFIDSQDDSRQIDCSYLGGDVGFNVHFGDSIDWEIGARAMQLSADRSISDSNAIIYDFDTIITAYTSIIYKYTMD